MTSEPTDPTGAGMIFAGHVGSLQSAEFERKKVLEARGGTLVATSAALLTLIFALSVLVTGNDLILTNTVALVLLAAASTSFLLSAGIAAYVQIGLSKYKVTNEATLDLMISQKWTGSADDALRMTVKRSIETTKSLRKSNDKKAKLVGVGLSFHVAATALLVGSLIAEFYTRR